MVLSLGYSKRIRLAISSGDHSSRSLASMYDFNLGLCSSFFGLPCLLFSSACSWATLAWYERSFFLTFCQTSLDIVGSGRLMRRDISAKDSPFQSPFEIFSRSDKVRRMYDVFIARLYIFYNSCVSFLKSVSCLLRPNMRYWGL